MKYREGEIGNEVSNRIPGSIRKGTESLTLDV